MFWLLLIVGLAAVGLIYTGKVSVEWKYGVLLGLFAGIILSVWADQIPIENLGIGTTTKWSVIIYAVVTVVAALGAEITGVREKIMYQYRHHSDAVDNIYFYALASSPMQEFVFRSYPLAFLMAAGRSEWWWYVAFSAVSYWLAHIILKNKYLNIYTLILGLIWAGVYYLIPDLLMVSISHTILGLLVLTDNQVLKSLGHKSEILSRTV